MATKIAWPGIPENFLGRERVLENAWLGSGRVEIGGAVRGPRDGPSIRNAVVSSLEARFIKLSLFGFSHRGFVADMDSLTL